MRLEIGVLASHDLRELHFYGMGTYGPAQADAYLAELMAKFGHIAQWPYAARERLPLRHSVRLVRYRAHNILYRVDDQTVTTLRILHHSANWLDLL